MEGDERIMAEKLLRCNIVVADLPHNRGSIRAWRRGVSRVAVVPSETAEGGGVQIRAQVVGSNPAGRAKNRGVS